jgi:Cu(I)/Ag(I) efflux system membrane fusion protein
MTSTKEKNMKNRISQQMSSIVVLALFFLSLGFGEKMAGHDHSKHQKKSDRHASHKKAPQIDKEVLAALYGNYLGIQKALAGDNLKEAKKEAKLITKSVKKLNDSGKKDLTKKLDKITTGIIEAKSISTARENFLDLSILTISLLEHNKYSGDKKAFVYHCPMAAGGKGADWLQASEGTKNPYYGKSMLACGSKTKTIIK